jgi:uncharacterized protein (TIGR03790 family)
MRHGWLAALVLVGCGGGSAPPDGSSPDLTQPDLAQPVACNLVKSVTTTGAPIPGTTIDVAVVDGGSGRSYTTGWKVDQGSVMSPTGAATKWTLPSKIATRIPVPLKVTATASAPGCIDEMVSATVNADFPNNLRTVVIYNPMQSGSMMVAQHYAAFRKIPDAQLCAVPYADPVTVAGADYPMFLKTALDCVDATGPQVEYIVPVWGVPYKLSGQVVDAFNKNAPATVCLDAVLTLGHGSDQVTAPTANPLLQPADPMTMMYTPHVPFGQLTDGLDFDFFMVSRIDGVDANAAIALVDRTEMAEQLVASGKLAGTVYVDGNKGLPHPSDYMFGSYDFGEWNIIGVENVMKKFGKYPVVADYNAEEFGTAPAPLTAPDALYYAGWYAFGHYNDVFTWNVGAIGGHLDSCSACDIRGNTDWSAVALQRGITATFGAVNEPYVLGLPGYDRFFNALVGGATYGEAGAESEFYVSWMLVWIGDPLYRPYPNGN